jgi:hypothetical protein
MSDAVSEQSSLVGILDRVQGWTVAADQKISVVTAVQTLACGFMFPELRDWLQNAATSPSLKVLLFAAGALLVAGVGLSLRALFPVIKEAAPRSATFFGSIDALTAAEYRALLDGMDAAAWQADYVSQIHVGARIAARKHRLVQLGVKVFVAGLGVVGICYAAALAGL